MSIERRLELLTLRIQKLIKDKRILTKENALLRYQLELIRASSLPCDTPEKRSRLFGW
ncbi:MAG: hypothetical protein ACRC1Z_26700 [Waterburya sp.]